MNWIDAHTLFSVAAPMLTTVVGLLTFMLRREFARTDQEAERSERIITMLNNHMQHTLQAQQDILDHMVEQTTILRLLANALIGKDKQNA